MEPMETRPDLKDEAAFGMGKVAVSWHADSSLVDHSCIAVLVAEHNGDGWVSVSSDTVSRGGGGDDDAREAWRIGLRVVRDIEGPGSRHGEAKAAAAASAKRRKLNLESQAKLKSGRNDATSNRADTREPTPAISLPLHHGDSYYMLGNFNHHHQHAVLAGRQCYRFSSTHRQVTAEHSLAHITKKCELALCDGARTPLASATFDDKAWHSEQAALNELEFGAMPIR
eukprot:SAG31_NODE_3740_length_3932_cov_3.662145_4_plen_227_part_00